MVDQVREWRPEVQIARSTDPQAKVHVIERDRENFVEAANLVVHLAADQEASRRHRADIMNHAQTVEIAGLVRTREPVRVAGDTPESDYDARMLNTPVRIKEFR